MTTEAQPQRVYLSGPMTGLPEFNFPAFHAAAEALRLTGLDVVNPAELNGSLASWNACLRKDIEALCRCDAIALLPGWENSNGAHLELHIAHRLGMEVMFVDQIVDGASPAKAAALTPYVRRCRHE